MFKMNRILQLYIFKFHERGADMEQKINESISFLENGRFHKFRNETHVYL